MFRRVIDLYLDKWKIDPYRKPLLLRGARQVGKTYAVRRLGQGFPHFVEINFERLEGAVSLFETEKNSKAEVDYLIQRGEHILPIEVKSGHGKTLRSLRLFLETHPKSPHGIRFSALDYSISEGLDSRPLYAVASLAHENQKEALRNLL